MTLSSPVVGVIPPSASAAHSSNLFAPPATAASAEAVESTHTSIQRSCGRKKEGSRMLIGKGKKEPRRDQSPRRLTPAGKERARACFK